MFFDAEKKEKNNKNKNTSGSWGTLPRRGAIKNSRHHGGKDSNVSRRWGVCRGALPCDPLCQGRPSVPHLPPSATPLESRSAPLGGLTTPEPPTKRNRKGSRCYCVYLTPTCTVSSLPPTRTVTIQSSAFGVVFFDQVPVYGNSVSFSGAYTNHLHQQLSFRPSFTVLPRFFVSFQTKQSPIGPQVLYKALDAS